MRRYQRRNLPVVQPLDPQSPELNIQQQPLWVPARGLDYVTPLSTFNRAYAAQLKNLRNFGGSFESRAGLTVLGDDTPGNPRLNAVRFVTERGAGYTIAFRQGAAAQYWAGDSWVDLPGSGSLTWSSGPNDPYAYTVFGNTLIFSNGIDGMMVFDPIAGITKLIVGAPSARFLMTFDGRVIAGNISDPVEHVARVRWSAKDNSLAWDPDTDAGIGAGFEDFKSSPGGLVDTQLTMLPMTDFTAILVRSSSIWTMGVTGNADAPFQFARRHGNIKCKAPRSVIQSPWGGIGVFGDDIYVFDETQISPVGGRIFQRLLDTVSNFGLMTGMFHPRWNEYWLSTNAEVYRYSFAEKEWVGRDVYPFTPISLSWADESHRIITFDELEGTFDDLVGTFDEMGVGPTDTEGALIVADDTFVRIEDETVSQDDTEDSPVEIVSGLIVAASLFHRTRIVEIQMEYECDEAQTLVFEYSVDGGTNWNAYSSADITPTTVPTLVAVRHEFTARAFQIRITSETLGQLRLIAVTPFTIDDTRAIH